jgi:hypothetical protein
MLMSRWTGMSWSQSSSIGVLMITLGLVVLKIGYDLGILSDRIFAMLVIDGAGHNIHDWTVALAG